MRSLTAILGAAALALLAAPADAGEIINVRDCGHTSSGIPQHVVDDGGGYWHCEPDYGPSGGGGGGDWGGTGEPTDPEPAGHGSPFDEPYRKLKCRECREAAAACIASAIATEDVCNTRMADFVRPRCDAMRDGGAGRRTSTPWGRSLADLARSPNTGEADWNGRDWGKFCSMMALAESRARCWATPSRNCEDAWASSHPSVAVSETSGPFTFSIDFMGAHLGAGSRSITHQYTWNARTGYREPCQDMAQQLAARCVSVELSCYSANRCSSQERRP